MADTERLMSAARWTDDCQGKQDYDGYAVLISTRYWPGPVFGFDSSHPDKGIHEIRRGQPSARTSLSINHRDEDDSYLNHGYGDLYEIASHDFIGDTEKDVKIQVEIWVQEQFDRVVSALRKEFGK